MSTKVDEYGVLWETVMVTGGASGTYVRAVCRPESCADGHRCGRIDGLGVTP